MFFGFALLDGVVGFAGALRAAEAHERWAPLLVEAIIGVAAALLAVNWLRNHDDGCSDLHHRRLGAADRRPRNRLRRLAAEAYSR